MYLKFLIKSLCFLLLFQSASRAETGADKVVVGSFSSATLVGWESKKFNGVTNYQLTDLAGDKVLKAESKGTASGLFKKQRIDLRRTPVMNWRWRIEKRLGKLNEQAKSGDDYVARVYVVISGGLAFWRTRAINYVWAGASPKGKVWPNAFAGDHAMMIALRSATDETGTWYTEKRNVLVDLKRQFGEEIRYIDAVAVMTDTDNGKGSAVAYYGDIFFSAN